MTVLGFRTFQHLRKRGRKNILTFPELHWVNISGTWSPRKQRTSHSITGEMFVFELDTFKGQRGIIHGAPCVFNICETYWNQVLLTNMSVPIEKLDLIVFDVFGAIL